MALQDDLERLKIRQAEVKEEWQEIRGNNVDIGHLRDTFHRRNMINQEIRECRRTLGVFQNFADVG